MTRSDGRVAGEWQCGHIAPSGLISVINTNHTRSSVTGPHPRSAHFFFGDIISGSKAIHGRKMRDVSDNRATWRSDLWRLQSIKCSAQDCLLIPVWKGWAVHRLSLTFCTKKKKPKKKKLGGEVKETLPLDSTHAHYGQKGVGSHTCAGCQTHCQTLKISLCWHEVVSWLGEFILSLNKQFEILV